MSREAPLKKVSKRRLERQQHAALKTLFRTSEALGEKTFVRLRGEVTRSYYGKRKKRKLGRGTD